MWFIQEELQNSGRWLLNGNQSLPTQKQFWNRIMLVLAEQVYPKPSRMSFWALNATPAYSMKNEVKTQFQHTLIELKFLRQLTNSRMFNNKISSIFSPIMPFSRNINGPVWISDSVLQLLFPLFIYQNISSIQGPSN